MCGGAFLKEDIPAFMLLAQREGWLCDPWEFEFQLDSFPQGCFVWREQGVTAGFVTSVRYGKSGWIGNLLVDSRYRRKGIGRVLMEQTVAAMLKEGVETVWLTASADGSGLYRKLGFVEIDSIQRWIGTGAVTVCDSPPRWDLESLRGIDRAGWGDRRDILLQASCSRGAVFSSSGGFICCQRWNRGVQIGPWGCLIGSEASNLLDKAIAPGTEIIFLDVPAGNHAAGALLRDQDFIASGSNLLMYLGVEPSYHSGNIFALASMGSMG